MASTRIYQLTTNHIFLLLQVYLECKFVTLTFVLQWEGELKYFLLFTDLFTTNRPLRLVIFLKLKHFLSVMQCTKIIICDPLIFMLTFFFTKFKNFFCFYFTMYCIQRENVQFKYNMGAKRPVSIVTIKISLKFLLIYLYIYLFGKQKPD